MGTGPRSQHSGKIRFNEKPGVQDEGVAMWLNVVHETSHIKLREIDRY